MSGIVALVAGGAPDIAFRIGVAMTLLQLGIGTTNDVVDAPRDAGQKAGKPIPDGLVQARSATAVAVACFGAGLVLATAIRLETGILALIVIAIGLAYDLRVKGTAWSWVPFAVGIPILPVFGWIGATGRLDPIFAVLLPTAVAAGAGLAIGNALVDVERDRAAGISSIAVALGSRRATVVAVGLFAVVWVLAWSSALRSGVGWIQAAAVAAVGLVPIVAAIAASSATSSRRERLWQAEAVGLAILAGVWLTAVARA